MNTLPLRLGTGQECTPLSIKLNIVSEILAKVIREEIYIKCIQNRKEDTKLFLFTDNMIMHKEKQKKYTKIILVPINKFNIKSNSQKSILQYEHEIKKTVQFTLI